MEQLFYIKMVGDRVTVVLNGEKVVDDVMENYWDRKPRSSRSNRLNCRLMAARFITGIFM